MESDSFLSRSRDNSTENLSRLAPVAIVETSTVVTRWSDSKELYTVFITRQSTASEPAKYT